MSELAAANLLHVFSFYLAANLIISFVRRFEVYREAVVLCARFPGRWPKLISRLSEHHGLLVTGQVVWPTAVALTLMLIQFVCSRLVWPHATLHLADLEASPWRAGAVVAAMMPMLIVDLYFLVRVGRFDRHETETYLDMAENWLTSWKSPAIRAVTFGYVDPRRIVDAEVKKGLEQLGNTVAWVMRWVAIQTACRVAFGLTLWLAWATHG